jgi:hypothetical protein
MISDYHMKGLIYVKIIGGSVSGGHKYRILPKKSRPKICAFQTVIIDLADHPISCFDKWVNADLEK